VVLPGNRRRRSLAVAFCCALSASCVAHAHVVGLGPTGIGETSVRQYYVLFGLVQFNEVNVQRMASDLTSYTIETEFSFVDLLLAPLLLPLTVTSRTVTVKT
jgi:ABC-type lipopolysaccharide export system ATPase subunit